jgi:hypothetical protein
MSIKLSPYCQNLLREAEEIEKNAEIMKAINFIPRSIDRHDISTEEWVASSEQFYENNKHVFENPMEEDSL